MGVIAVPSTVPITENESFERSYISLITCCSIQRWNHRPITKFGIKPTAVLGKSYQTRRRDWSIAFALDTGEGPDSSGQESIEEDTSGLGSTRLGRIVRAGSKQLLEKLNAARKNLPMKVFLLLLGFYTANALATILGQTGDWDVLVAGVVVAAIEGIGVLMYRKPFSLSVGKFHSLVVMVNYWKAGVCLGLFVDAFKLGS